MLGSDRDSDESIGVVIRKTIYNGKLLESELEQAEARVKSRAARLRSLYREGERAIKNAQQTVSSMSKAIELAKETAQVTREEIAYLKRQLVIGGSTLDSVLSGARLYEAEAQVVNFQAEKRKAELEIVSSLGLLSEDLGLDEVLPNS